MKWSHCSAGALLALALLGGCTVGPAYHPAAALGTNAMPAAFQGAAGATNGAVWQPGQPSAHLPRGAWWQIFGDPELNRLESLAAANNQELAAAVARFEQARALVNVARADFFPHLSADPSASRQRTSVNQPFLGKPVGFSATYDNFTVPLDAGWEPDLWGRIRRQVEAARAQLAASADDTEAVKLSLQAELATDHFTLRAQDAEYDLLQRTVTAYQLSLQLTRNRRAGGIASDLDVSQAETQLRTAQAQLPAVDRSRTKLRHALATLCGQPATGFAVAPADVGIPGVPSIPVALPSELLERRPDVAAAERRMAAANAAVGVAQTAFYPRLVLNGTAGLQSLDAGTLFESPSRLWAVGPSLQWPLFTGGRLRAQLAAARASYAETVAHYRQTVLSAFEETEDQLAAQRLLASQLDAEEAALAAARHTLEIANNRYKAGLVTYLEVATAQSAALDHERTVVELRDERLATSVALIRAMGGGWSSNPDIPPTS